MIEIINDGDFNDFCSEKELASFQSYANLSKFRTEAWEKNIVKA